MTDDTTKTEGKSPGLQTLTTRIEDLLAREREQEKLVDALRESEERFRMLIDALQVGVTVHSPPHGEILLANPMALEFLSVTEDQLLGRTTMDSRWSAIHEDGSPCPGEEMPVYQALATGKPVRDVVVGIARPAKGDRVWLLVTAMPQLAPDGSVKQVVSTFTDISARKLAEDTVRAQAEALAQLSTPLIPISDEVVVMPLIGIMDARRAEQVITTLLSGITERRAVIALIDITGVTTVDVQVANTLILAARAVRLLGAEVVLTGIRPSVAQTLVGLGVDLEGIMTLGTLQSGIAYALRRQG
jgi:rsbT co-antagonist protein RsbR